MNMTSRIRFAPGTVSDGPFYTPLRVAIAIVVNARSVFVKKAATFLPFTAEDNSVRCCCFNFSKIKSE